MPSVYSLKPRFQSLLLPLVRQFAQHGITANQLTILACLLSIALGVLLVFLTPDTRWFLLLPPFLLLRMALNAMDGMLARDFHQKSALGTYLNEICDVVSDSCLYAPFAWVASFEPGWIAAVIVLTVISEMSGALAPMTGVGRRYDGPMGKSDRAVVFSALAFWIGFGFQIPQLVSYLFPRVMAVMLALTVMNRVRSGLAELHSQKQVRP